MNMLDDINTEKFGKRVTHKDSDGVVKPVLAFFGPDDFNIMFKRLYGSLKSEIHADLTCEVQDFDDSPYGGRVTLYPVVWKDKHSGKMVESEKFYMMWENDYFSGDAVCSLREKTDYVRHKLDLRRREIAVMRDKQRQREEECRIEERGLVPDCDHLTEKEEEYLDSWGY